MSSFTTPLEVCPTENGEDWILLEEFDYAIGSKESPLIVHVPKGFITDFASIPRFLFFLPAWAKYNKAPIVHDFLYQDQEVCGIPINRKYADDVFLEAMIVDMRNHKKMGKFIAYLEYYAVRLFAFTAWKKRGV